MNHLLDILATGTTTAFIVWLMARVGLFPMVAIFVESKEKLNG